MKNLLASLIGIYVNVLSYLSKSYAENKALSVFSKPRKGRITEIQRDFLDTAFKEELKFKDTHIMTYRWLGNKQTVLLAHGWESNSARWKPLVLNLKKKGFNIVALDAPAHGNSGSNYFNTILLSEFIHVVAKRFNAEIIIGHSLGGMASVFCQNKYQLKSVKKLILLGTPSEYSDILKRYTDMLGYNQHIKTRLNAIIIERYGIHPNTFSTAKYLETINSEGLIIHDEDDDVIPYGDALLIKDSFKKSKLITTKGIGHSLINDIVMTHISEFVED